VLIQAALLLPAARVALRFVTIARLQVLGAGTLTGSRLRSRGRRIGLSPQTTARLVRIVAEHGPFRAKCLEQSLVLRWLLLRQGIDARLLFGARKKDDEMQAHAWVEVNGLALNEDNGVYRDFSPLDELVAGN